MFYWGILGFTTCGAVLFAHISIGVLRFWGDFDIPHLTLSSMKYSSSPIPWKRVSMHKQNYRKKRFISFFIKHELELKSDTRVLLCLTTKFYMQHKLHFYYILLISLSGLIQLHTQYKHTTDHGALGCKPESTAITLHTFIIYHQELWTITAPEQTHTSLSSPPDP